MRKYERGRTPFHIPWSPAIHRASKKDHFYNLWWRYCKTPTNQLRSKLEFKAGTMFTFDRLKPHTWVRNEFNQAIKELRELRKQAEKE